MVNPLKKKVRIARKQKYSDQDIFAAMFHGTKVKGSDLRKLIQSDPKLKIGFLQFKKKMEKEGRIRPSEAQEVREYLDNQIRKAKKWHEKEMEKKEILNLAKKLPKFLRGPLLKKQILPSDAKFLALRYSKIKERYPEIAKKVKTEKGILSEGVLGALEHINRLVKKKETLLARTKFREDLQEILPIKVTEQIAYIFKDIDQARQFASVFSQLNKLNPKKAQSFLKQRARFRNIPADVRKMEEMINKLSLPETMVKKSGKTTPKDIENARKSLLKLVLATADKKHRKTAEETIAEMDAGRVRHLLTNDMMRGLFVITLGSKPIVSKMKKKGKNGIIMATAESSASFRPKIACPSCKKKGVDVRELITYADEPPIFIINCPHCKKGTRSRSII